MSRKYNRKTAPKVVGGHVLRKNNHTKTAALGYVLDRERPRKGFVHVLRKKDVHDFTDIIPGWAEYSVGLESIILSRGEEDAYGLYDYYRYEETGVIWLSAWNKDELWLDISVDYFKKHKWLFDQFGLAYEEKVIKDPQGRGKFPVWGCYYTVSQARAFMLMRVLLHEIGHHVDWYRSNRRGGCRGGEPFAEKFAEEVFPKVWPAYIDKFGHPEGVSRRGGGGVLLEWEPQLESFFFNKGDYKCQSEFLSAIFIWERREPLRIRYTIIIMTGSTPMKELSF